MKKLHLIAGARPNFMKIAPLIRAIELKKEDLSYSLIHTGQHYDHTMSDVFFEELGIPAPNHHLDCGGGSHAEQTAKIMVEYEKLCLDDMPDIVVVVGDVNSTLACSIVAKKLNLQVAHIEAGLRSGDLAMPEEINRLVTDSISDLFFVTEPSGRDHLYREGKDEAIVHYVGHVMVDNVLYQKNKLGENQFAETASGAFKAKRQDYAVVTLHRPSNVDDKETFLKLAGALKNISTQLPIAFPVHPRTRQRMEQFGIDLGPNVSLLEPLGYMEFLNLWKDAQMVLTDSGGLQEETTALGIPCLTLRENTERPITVEEGTNVLVGVDPVAIEEAAQHILDGHAQEGRRPELWDGKAAERIVDVLIG